MSPLPEAAAAAPLPADVATLQALLLAERASAARLAGHNEQLRAIIKELQRALFGRRSEKTVDPDQLQLALEDLEQALAQSEAQDEKTDATLQASRRQQRRGWRGLGRRSPATSGGSAVGRGIRGIRRDVREDPRPMDVPLARG